MRALQTILYSALLLRSGVHAMHIRDDTQNSISENTEQWLDSLQASCVDCTRDCAKCTKRERDGENDVVTLDVSDCKGSGISWLCGVRDVISADCITDNGDKDSVDGKIDGSIKCESDILGARFTVSRETTTLPIQVHDGQFGGVPNESVDDSEWCGGTGGSCHAQDKSGVCEVQIAIDFPDCGEEVPSEPSTCNDHIDFPLECAPGSTFLPDRLCCPDGDAQCDDDPTQSGCTPEYCCIMRNAYIFPIFETYTPSPTPFATPSVSPTQSISLTASPAATPTCSSEPATTPTATSTPSPSQSSEAPQKCDDSTSCSACERCEDHICVPDRNACEWKCSDLPEKELECAHGVDEDATCCLEADGDCKPCSEETCCLPPTEITKCGDEAIECAPGNKFLPDRECCPEGLACSILGACSQEWCCLASFAYILPITPTPTPTPTPSSTSSTPTASPQITPTSFTETPTPSSLGESPSPTRSPASSPDVTPSPSPLVNSPSPTKSPTSSPDVTPSPSCLIRSPTPSRTATSSPKATPTRTSVVTPTPTPISPSPSPTTSPETILECDADKLCPGCERCESNVCVPDASCEEMECTDLPEDRLDCEHGVIDDAKCCEEPNGDCKACNEETCCIPEKPSEPSTCGDEDIQCPSGGTPLPDKECCPGGAAQCEGSPFLDGCSVSRCCEMGYYYILPILEPPAPTITPDPLPSSSPGTLPTPTAVGHSPHPTTSPQAPPPERPSPNPTPDPTPPPTGLYCGDKEYYKCKTYKKGMKCCENTDKCAGWGNCKCESTECCDETTKEEDPDPEYTYDGEVAYCSADYPNEKCKDQKYKENEKCCVDGSQKCGPDLEKCSSSHCCVETTKDDNNSCSRRRAGTRIGRGCR